MLAARDGFDPDALAGRVSAVYVGAEGNHVQVRVAGGEQSAFQPGVDHLQIRGAAELRGVDLLAQIEQRRTWVRRPARIGTVLPGMQRISGCKRDQLVGQRIRPRIVQRARLERRPECAVFQRNDAEVA